ncbi:Ribose-5-phosphate isomerase [Salix suchowensis]|nr:Ribose-5-phosphate isomerase [Salix suchowensis]
MASSLPKKPSNPSLNIKPSYKRPSNIVDANLSVLRERIENVKIKERLERCCRCEYGWNYSPEYKFKLKKELGFPTQFIDLASLFLGTVGLTCLGGTLFLCAVSLLVRLIQ